jgi:hypothetical protein
LEALQMTTEDKVNRLLWCEINHPYPEVRAFARECLDDIRDGMMTNFDKAALKGEENDGE